VFVNGGDTVPAYDQILVDLDASMTRAFDYLINKKGIRHIGYISGWFSGGRLCHLAAEEKAKSFLF
jgi:hypothetical protein